MTLRHRAPWEATPEESDLELRGHLDMMFVHPQFQRMHPPKAAWTGVEGRADMDAGC